MDIGLFAIPAFVAGILTFLAPCTLPLVPGFLAFISGVTPKELQEKETLYNAHIRIFMNGVLYVLGFSTIFILLGTLFGLGGAAFAMYRVTLARLGGVLVMIFGLYLMGVTPGVVFKGFDKERRLRVTSLLHPGKPLSSFLFGAVFAFGWTPCVGPILGSVLLLASSSATVGTGALLLAIFSAGLAIPFLLMAAFIGYGMKVVSHIGNYLGLISKIGGAFLFLIGALMALDMLGLWNVHVYDLFDFIGYERLLDYL